MTLNIDEVYGGTWLRAVDIKGRGDLLVTIASVGLTEFKDGQKQVVLGFRQGKKSLGLNKTNSRRIAQAYGSDADQWVGRDIVIFATTTEYAGDIVDCIRVKIPEGGAKAAPAPAATTDPPAEYFAEDNDTPF